MSQTGMPILRDGRLGLPQQAPIAVDSKAWFAWLAQATRFCYQPTLHLPLNAAQRETAPRLLLICLLI